MDFSRTIIIGNSGAGKSWLAEQLAQAAGIACIELDRINWLADGYNQARERSAAIALLKESTAQEKWIIEGIYGWLVQEVISSATTLLWLCPSEAECVANIRSRGPRGNASEQSFAELLDWAATYRIRSGSSSFQAHQAMFHAFSGSRRVLQNREDVQALLAY
jgi:adenylate kinase family enzyme